MCLRSECLTVALLDRVADVEQTSVLLQLWDSSSKTRMLLNSICSDGGSVEWPAETAPVRNSLKPCPRVVSLDFVLENSAVFHDQRKVLAIVAQEREILEWVAFD